MSDESANRSTLPHRSPDPSRCALCERSGVRLTAHHLVPRMRHRQRRTQRRFSREQRQTTTPLCPPCHAFVHRTLTERELADHYHSISRLKRHPEIAKFVRWVERRPADTKVPMPKQRRRR